MEIKRLFDFIYHQKENHPLSAALAGQVDGKWKTYSTDKVLEQACALSRGLIELGLESGDRVGVVVYTNRPEWTILDIALQQIGAVNVPLYPTISPKEYSFILSDAGAKFCFVGKGDLYEKVHKAQPHIETLREIYCFDEEIPATHWSTLFRSSGQEEVERRMAAVQPDDLATLIYTSGTTGQPKGVMLNHHNIVSNVLAVVDLMPLVPGDRILSFLPLCHIFERTASYAYQHLCVSVYYTGTDNLGGEEGDLQQVSPHYFTTVPRLLEKVYEKIYNRGLQLSGTKRKLFFWALELTKSYDFDKVPKGLGALKWTIADKLIFSKWRAALGGRVKGVLSGAAPCPSYLIQTFSAAGIPIREGYGLTETSPGLAIGRLEAGGAMLGAVGPAIKGVELMIDESDGAYQPGEGEILAHGPNVMMGYYNRPEETSRVMKEIDGKQWFCTGDIGRLLKGPNGREFLQITDRKKELLKTSGGKYVAPAPIENKLKESFLVEQVMVVGDSRKFVSALIVPAEEALKDWCAEHDIEWQGLQQMTRHPEVQRKFQQLVEEKNAEFNQIEQIKKFSLVAGNWEPVKADGTDAELTPTMKLKRRVILDKYGREIEEMYTA